MRRSFRYFASPTAIVAILATALVAPASAAPSGKTSTAEIVAGSALLFYLGKLGIDNGKADRAGRSADAILDADRSNGISDSWVPPASTSLRSVRVAILNDVATLAGADKPTSEPFQTNRKSYESLRACWNNFVFATPPPKPATTTTPDQKTSTTTVAAVPVPTPPPGCMGAFNDIKVSYVPPRSDLDQTDLASAIAGGPTLFQQVQDLRVGSYVDVNDLRAQYLYDVALALHYAIGGPPKLRPGVATITSAVNISALATSCVTALNGIGCASALSDVESVAASGRRKDVACDIAARSWLPTYTAIRRIYRSGGGAMITKDTLFGAVPGC